MENIIRIGYDIFSKYRTRVKSGQYSWEEAIEKGIARWGKQYGFTEKNSGEIRQFIDRKCRSYYTVFSENAARRKYFSNVPPNGRRVIKSTRTEG